MTIEDVKRAIEESVLHAFDRWSQRNQEKIITGLLGTADQKIDATERARQNFLFLSKRALAPGFDRYVVQQVASNPMINRQRSVILRGCLISIIREEGATIAELISGSESPRGAFGDDVRPGDQQYVRRSVQRFVHERFDETVFQQCDDFPGPTKPDDERFARVSSVFASVPLPQTPTTELAKLSEVADFLNTVSNPDVMKRLALDSIIRMVTPEYLTGLLRFKEECTSIMAATGEGGDRAGVLARELSHFSFILGEFYAHFQSILGVYWYRGRRPERKHDLMEKGFPLAYSASDARKARVLSVELTGSAEHSSFIIELGADALFEYNLHASHDYLVRECTGLQGLGPVARGILWENAGIRYRRAGDYRSMGRHLHKALAAYRESEDGYRTCVALKNLGESEWMLGNKAGALKLFGKAESESVHLPGVQRFDVYGNLGTACLRLDESALSLGFFRKALDFADFVEPEKVLRVDQIIGQLSHS